MDFAWVVDALRRGLKVTRKSWLEGRVPVYLYMSKQTPDRRVIMIHNVGPDMEWQPGTELLLDADDWVEYAGEYQNIHNGKKHVFIRETTGSSGLSGGKAVEGQIDYAKGVVHCGEDTGYMAEQLEMLADIYAEKISQRVVELLQKTNVSLSKEG